jgi:polyphenol oxidase
MLHQIHNFCVTSSLLETIPHVFHGYSTRLSGDMQKDVNRSAFLLNIGAPDKRFVKPEQVHGICISIVDSHTPSPVLGSDGLVMGLNMNKHGDVIMGVIVADCVPLLFVDRKCRSLGVAHAGWRGTLKMITANVVNNMALFGTNPRDIIVSIGPHIGMCCYTVPEDRALCFIQQFGDDTRVAHKFADGWHLDIGYVNALQLKRSGIPTENIDLAISCTSCQNDRYYSYRKDTRQTFGEIIACIGFN